MTIKQGLGYLILVALSVGMVFGMVMLLNRAFDIQEVDDCHKYQDYAGKFEAFYLTQWQADMCAAHDIKINAPVIK